MELTTEAKDSQKTGLPIVDHQIERSVASEEITISLYENEVPPFVESDLVCLYKNIFSSLVKFKIDGNIKGISVYVARKGGNTIAIILFRRENKNVFVLNEAIELNEADIQQFSSTIFSVFKSVSVISFHAIQTTTVCLSYPYQRFNCLEDIVLILPSTPQEYLARLGKNMRSSIRRYTKKIDQIFPSFRYTVYEKDVSEEHIRAIVRLSSARMAVKNQVSLHDDKKTEQLIRLVKMHGLVGVATIDDRVCAGVICSRLGENYFMHVIAHDPQYDEYRLGKLCCYRTICECINRRGKEFHFLWGRYEYKYKLLGVQRELDRFIIYRSRLQFLLNGGTALKIALKGYGRQAKRWLLTPEHADGFRVQLAFRIVNGVRNLRRFRSELVSDEE